MLAQAFVDERRRERCAFALAEVAHEKGAGKVTVALVTARARVARNTFYEQFGNLKDALGYAHELGSRRLQEAFEGAAVGSGAWEERLEAGIEALLAQAASDGYLAELALVHGRGRLEGAMAPFNPELTRALAQTFGQGRVEGAGSGPGPRAEELLAHGMLSVVAERLWRGEGDLLTGLAGDLSELVKIIIGRDPAEVPCS